MNRQPAAPKSSKKPRRLRLTPARFSKSSSIAAPAYEVNGNGSDNARIEMQYVVLNDTVAPSA